jgi:CheY-like chemotaxis protein
MDNRSTQVGQDLDFGPEVKPRVLLVEDNPLQSRISQVYTEKLGVEVDAVTHSYQALEAFSRNNYALILVDWRLPDLDGLETTSRIREIDRKNGKHTPIVALTARALDGDREKCLAAGMDDYLSKPFTAAQLKEVIKRWIPDKFES